MTKKGLADGERLILVDKVEKLTLTLRDMQAEVLWKRLRIDDPVNQKAEREIRALERLRSALIR